MKENHIVLTTINIPVVLDEIQKNLERNHHLDDTICWVIGDRKTPEGCSDYCNEVTDNGLETHFLNISVQDKWGKEFPHFYDRMPYNNESRRNIGYIHALEYGCNRLISIDDDNFPTDDDFIGGHCLTGKEWTGLCINEISGYHNICEHLSIRPERQIFPRGYPFELRDSRNNPVKIKPNNKITIGVTEGLWLKDPDIDATTWLNGKVESTHYNEPDNIVLTQTTFSPINTQNTSVIRDLIPAYFCVPMGYPIFGEKIERYGDIWGGYFLQVLMEGTPYHVAFGRPVVEHRRNYHQYMDDLRHEYWGMILTDCILKQLRINFHPESRDICERVQELSEFLTNKMNDSLPNWCPSEARHFISLTGYTIGLWADTCGKIIG